MKKIRKQYILLILNPQCEKIRGAHSPGYYYKPRVQRPYILISIHLEPSEAESMVDFSILSHAIPHEILHELYEDNVIINEKLSEFEKHCNEQMLKDFQ